MRTYIHLLIVFGMFFVTFLVSTCLADEADDKAKRFLFLVEGMKFEREKIVSGVVRGKGERSRTRDLDGKSHVWETDLNLVTSTAPVEYLIAFDFAENKMRVDRKEPNFDDTGGYEHQLGQYIETQDSIVYDSHVLNKPYTCVIFVAQPKEGDYDWRGKRYCSPLDIRNIGSLDLWRFTHGGGPSFSDRMATYTRIPEVLVEEENGIVRYEYHNRDEKDGELNRRVTWIDTQNGFTFMRHLDITEFDWQPDHPWICQDTHASWEKKAGVWVPVDIVFENKANMKEERKFVMTFDWESVNKPVDDEYFSYCDFEVSSGQTPVAKIPTKAQGAAGQADHLGTYVSLCGTKEGRLLMKQIAEKESTLRFWQWTTMIIGIVLIVAGLALRIMAAIKRRKQRFP